MSESAPVKDHTRFAEAELPTVQGTGYLRLDGRTEDSILDPVKQAIEATCPICGGKVRR